MSSALTSAARTVLAGCLCALALAACGSSDHAPRTRSTLTRPLGPPGTEAQINPATCTAAQLEHRKAPIVYRPRRLGRHQVPLVLALHGAGGDGRAMVELTGLENVASRYGFVAVFPSACDLREPWGSGQELYYIDSLIHRQVSSDNVDPRRVYIAGFSAGGVDAWRMACMFSHDVAAVAVVSAALSVRVQRACVLSKPVSQLLMAGTADGGRWTGTPGRSVSAPQAAAWWRGVDRCTNTSTVRKPVAGVIETMWSACARGSHVALVELVGAAHVWPPAGIGSPSGYNASAAVWSFLSALGGGA